MQKPKVNSEGQKELDKAQENFDNFSEQVKSFNSFDPSASVEDKDEQTKISRKEAKQVDAPYLKPVRSVNRTNYDKSKTYFDEKHRSLRDRDWEYVKCIVENYEIIGEAVEVWTGKWGCDPTHYWRVPVNKPVWIPRHLAEQLAKCQYHRLVMDDSTIREQSYIGAITGGIVVDVVKQRIDARPVGFGF